MSTTIPNTVGESLSLYYAILDLDPGASLDESEYTV
jgi:hypothetical protein